jgi:hypothetical protein
VAIFCRRSPLFIHMSRARQDALASRPAGGELTLDSDALADPGRNASDCGDHPLSSGDNMILQVDRLGEKRNPDSVRVPLPPQSVHQRNPSGACGAATAIGLLKLAR